MKKKLLIIAAVLIVIIAVLAAYVWHLMGKALYEPGMVRAEEDLSAPLDPPQQADEENFWCVETGIRLYHFSSGSGRPVLVVHGGPGQPIVEPLAALAPLEEQFEFHYYDHRGCGRSARPIEDFASADFYSNIMSLNKTLGLAAQIADIERIRRILGEEKLILLGHSFGGFLASLYAAEFPERVERMVLVAPADLLVMPIKGDDLFEVVEARLSEDRQTEFSAFRDEYLDFGDLFEKTEEELIATNGRFAEFYLEAVNHEVPLAAAPEAPDLVGGWMVQATYLSMGRRHDYRDALEGVGAPVLVLHGTEDLLPDEGSRRYSELLSGSRFEAVEGADHFLLFEESTKVADRLGAFLRATD